MSDNDEEQETMGQMKKRHYREVKELQIKWEKAMRGIPKKEETKKKEAQASAKAEEAELVKKQQKEIADLARAAAELDKLALEKQREAAEADAREHAAKGPSKGEKKKAAKAEKENELQAEIDEAAKTDTVGKAETRALKAQLEPQGFIVKEIDPDGNCMYSAFSDQISRDGITASWKALRQQVGDHLRTNKDNIIPFMLTDEGELLDDAAFEEYVHKVVDTHTWGGHLELQALATLYRRQVVVYLAGSAPLKFGEEFGGEPIRLSYHKHAYTLGEHYNSVIKP